MKSTKLRINGRNYRLLFKWENDLCGDVNAGKINGRCDHENTTLTVSRNLPGGSRRCVALHEIIHAVSANSGCGLAEPQVEALTNGIFAALRDNPKFAKWLLEE